MRIVITCLVLVIAACGDDAASPTLDAFDSNTLGDLASDTGDVGLDTAPPDTKDASDTNAADTQDMADADAAADVPPPPGEFVRGHVLQIDLELAAQDWATLRAEKRTIFELLGPNCMAGPAPDVFNYYRGDVTVDGVTVADAGLRKKGFLGSLDATRPALRIELDEFVEGQDLAGLERLTLNNGRQDPSRLKQCLAYDLFRAAGVPAPRCAFAHVRVNGEDLGLYNHIEAVKKPFLRDHFGEPLGALWEGQLSDLRDGWLATFEAKLDDGDQAPLRAVVAALATPDEALITALEQVVDLDEFITFWAVETLVAHWDGYAGNNNNYFIYSPPGDRRLRFIPWGVDGTFINLDEQGGTQAALANSALSHRLYTHPVGRERYEAELRRLLETIWDEVGLVDRIARWDELTFGQREAGSGEAGSTAVAELKSFVATRRARILAALENPTEGYPPPLRPPPCTTPNGEVVSTFETTWNTLEIENLFLTGNGSLEVNSAGLPELSFGDVGAKAGESPEGGPGSAQLIIAGQVVGAGFIVVVLDATTRLTPGTHEVGGDPQAVLYYLDPGGAASLLGLLAGTLTLTEADDTPGAPIKGSLDTTIYALF